MYFEIRGLLQNGIFHIGPIRHWVHRHLGRTGMNGSIEAARERFFRYCRDLEIADKDILELGPGHTPQVLMLALQHGARTCVGLDIERLSDAHRSQGIRLNVYDGTVMPYVDASFDVIWSSDVLEHVRNPGLTIHESHRILRPDGVFLAVVDLRDHYFLDDEERWLRCLKYPEWLWLAMTSMRSSFVNRLRASEWRRLFEEAGFEIVKFDVERSSVLQSLHERGDLPRHGRALSHEDAAVFRLEVLLRRMRDCRVDVR